VESLSAPGEPLHPIQAALVECHASQCGFCTPGFVMSLFGLYKEHAAPTRPEVETALAGNLCRCTGYRPIVAAAQRMYELAAETREAVPDVPWVRLARGARGAEAAPARDALRALRRERTLTLHTREGSFWAPVRLDAVCELLVQHPDARVLAGGTDLGLWVTKQDRALPKLIYLGNVAELKCCEQREEALWIGAGARLSDALPLLCAEYPELEELCARFASPPIRNAGTLVGNVANASPVGDLPPVLLALDARVGLRLGKRARELPLSAFFLDYQRTARQPGELLTHVSVPRRRAGQRLGAYKVSKRFDQDIAALCAVFRVQFEQGVLHEVRAAFAGMAAIPKRATALEQLLEGAPPTDAVLREAALALARDFTPISDMRASADYRAQVAANLVRRFFSALADDPAAQGLYRRAR
jgi:xanthine dehydrogenase small subunit